MRKSFQSFASAWKDILTFIFFYVVIILSFAIVGSKLLNVVPDGSDDYRMNYTSVDKNIFITYVLATYDSYPDNQMDAIQQFMPNYFYFILFVFLNMFLFSSIPGSLIYTQFKETRSKIILLDEMKQQHSLILAFVTLTVDNPNLELDVLIRFLLHVYKYKIRYVEYITDICLSLDDNNSRSIVHSSNSASKRVHETHKNSVGQSSYASTKVLWRRMVGVFQKVHEHNIIFKEDCYSLAVLAHRVNPYHRLF